jgi:AcrR family transcriptional regulator
MPPASPNLRPGQGQPRGRRADAQRNRELLLTAAREVFSERGARAPLDDIARRAGIGNATMYRHFASRRELLIAVYADEVEALCSRGETLLAEQPPADALFAWLRTFIAHVATKRDLVTAIPNDPIPNDTAPNDQGAQRTALFDGWHQAMRLTASRLLTSAQSAGTIRADLNAGDLLVLANGIAVTSAGTDQADRCLELLRYGIGG